MIKTPFQTYKLQESDFPILEDLLNSNLKFETLKMSFDGVGWGKDIKGNFEELEIHKNIIIKQSKNLYQIWYSAGSLNNHDEIINLLKKEFNKLYPEINSELELHTEFTFYNEGCFIEPHYDGTDPNRYAGFLIYLNKNYKKENGGLLRVTNPSTNEITEIVPEFGQVVCIDYVDNQVLHEVTRVNEGTRLAICAFIHRKK